MARRLPKDRVIWLDRGWFPTYYGFCPSERAWKRELRLIADRRGDKSVLREPYPTADARASHFAGDDGKVLIVVTVAERLDERMRETGASWGLIVHEAAHVWQAVCDQIGEESPSREFEAYAIQAITQNLVWAYQDTRLKASEGKNGRPLRNNRRRRHLSRRPRQRGMGGGRDVTRHRKDSRARKG